MVKAVGKSKLRKESKTYFTALGAHIARLRKIKGYTQAELARRLGVSQQAVFAYELGDRRISVLLLVRIARAFGTSVQELVSLARPVRDPDPRLSPWAQRHAERLQRLPKMHQRFVIKILDSLEESNGAAKHFRA